MSVDLKTLTQRARTKRADSALGPHLVWRTAEYDHTIVTFLEVADSFWSRFAGLMGRAELPLLSGLLLTHTNNIHTFFMRFPIDVLYLDADFHVLGITRNLKPWRIDKPVWKAQHVLELPGGALPQGLVGGRLIPR